MDYRRLRHIRRSKLAGLSRPFFLHVCRRKKSFAWSVVHIPSLPASGLTVINIPKFFLAHRCRQHKKNSALHMTYPSPF